MDEDGADSLGIFSSGTVKLKQTAEKKQTWNASLNKNPFQFLPPTRGNAVVEVNKQKQEEQIEAVIEMIDRIRLDNTPRGLTLDSSVVSKDEPDGNLENVKKILGSGNSAGEVVLVEDSGTGKDYAKKKLMLCQFNKDEIKAWVHLADAGLAPMLYQFQMKDNSVVLKMEPIEGKTLQELIDDGVLVDPLMARSFSLLLLQDLLSAFEVLKKGGFTHADMHGGNVMVLPSIDIKLFDFGKARHVLRCDGDHAKRLKDDVVGIIRMFCATYTCGIDFNDLATARKALETNDYREISQYLGHLQERERQELFGIMTRLFDTVRRERAERYSDTSTVLGDVEGKLPRGKDLEDMKKKIAVMLFPDRIDPSKVEDAAMVPESEVNDPDYNPVLDDPQLIELAASINLHDYKQEPLF